MSDRPDLTMMYSVHLAFRRDIDRLAAAIGSGDVDPATRAAIMANWNLFHALLEHHHQAEDRVLWVELLEADPEAATVVDSMAEQHEALDAALEATHTRMQAWGMGEGDAPLAGLTAVGELLRAHLTDEEEQALPLVGSRLTAEAWGKFTGYNMELNTGIDWTVPWLAEGKPDEVRAAIWGMLPPEIVAGPGQEWSASYAQNVQDAFGVTAAVAPPA